MSEAHHAASPYQKAWVVAAFVLVGFLVAALLPELGAAIGNFFQNLAAGVGNSLNITNNAYTNSKAMIHGLIGLIFLGAIAYFVFKK
jgi:hypothetical protein